MLFAEILYKIFNFNFSVPYCYFLEVTSYTNIDSTILNDNVLSNYIKSTFSLRTGIN